MIISSATPSELVDWFHTDHKHGQTILCVLVAPAQSDQAKLTAIIETTFKADAMLGEKVAFLLLHPNVRQIVALGGLSVIPVLQGTTFVSPRTEYAAAYQLRDTALFRDVSSEHDFLRQEMAKQSARAMARFASDFMQLFMVAPHELPVLCVLIRGLKESVVIPLQQNWGEDDLLGLFAQLQNCASDAEGAGQNYNFLFNSLPARLRRLEQDSREFLAKKDKLAELADGILSRHKASEADLKMVADFLAGQDQSSVSFNRVLESLSIGSSERFRKDGRIAKAQRLLNQLATLRTENGFNQWSGEIMQSVTERAEALVAQRARLLSNLQKIRHGRLIATMASTNKISRVERQFNIVERVVGIGQKSAAAIESLRNLIF